MTAPIAVRVDSPASGHRCPYVSTVVRALAMLEKLCSASTRGRRGNLAVARKVTENGGA